MKTYVYLHTLCSTNIISYFVTSIGSSKTSQRRRSHTDSISFVGSFSEPRRSARHRREVYGTLNESLMVKKCSVEPKKDDDGEDQEVISILLIQCCSFQLNLHYQKLFYIVFLAEYINQIERGKNCLD